MPFLKNIFCILFAELSQTRIFCIGIDQDKSKSLTPLSAIDPPLFQDSELSSDSVSGSWRFVWNFENLSKIFDFWTPKTHASKAKWAYHQLNLWYFCCFLAPAAHYKINWKNTEFLSAKTRRSKRKSIFNLLKFGYFCCFLAPAARKNLCKIRCDA